MRTIILSAILLLNIIIAQDDTKQANKIYWNSLATAVTIGVPLADDPSLNGGRIQIRVSFDDGNIFNDLGIPNSINKKDIDDVKEIIINENTFESIDGYNEGGEAYFIAEIWDRAGNNIIGSVSDSILTIDETKPFLISLLNESTNSFDLTLSNPSDTVTFKLITSEPINMPEFLINGDEFLPAGTGNTWIVQYPCEDADDGPIDFVVNYEDFAQNPGEPVTVSSDSTIIVFDGTEPELINVRMYTSNQFDSTHAVEADTVFLKFLSSESIRDIKVLLNGNQAVFKNEDSLTFIFYHVFTASDSERVIPLSINFFDKSGNIGEVVQETTDDSEVVFDMTPPDAFKVGSIGSISGKREIPKPVETDSTGAIIESSQENTILSSRNFIILISVLGMVFMLIWISWFRIFSKAGQSGWKAFIPIFNLIILTKIFEKPIWWILIYLVLPIGYIIVALQLAKLFMKNTVFICGLIFLPFIFYPLLAFGKSMPGVSLVDKSKNDKKNKK
tara:strand:+ start:774 stop:2282 length:1509 start_codon:yes stop_codon:yes gene_type:complete